MTATLTVTVTLSFTFADGREPNDPDTFARQALDSIASDIPRGWFDLDAETGYALSDVSLRDVALDGEPDTPLELCRCGEHYHCPDGWHRGDDLPCTCTPDCALDGEGDGYDLSRAKEDARNAAMAAAFYPPADDDRSIARHAGPDDDHDGTGCATCTPAEGDGWDPELDDTGRFPIDADERARRVFTLTEHGELAALRYADTPGRDVWRLMAQLADEYPPHAYSTYGEVRDIDTGEWVRVIAVPSLAVNGAFNIVGVDQRGALLARSVRVGSRWQVDTLV